MSSTTSSRPAAPSQDVSRSWCQRARGRISQSVDCIAHTIAKIAKGLFIALATFLGICVNAGTFWLSFFVGVIFPTETQQGLNRIAALWQRNAVSKMGCTLAVAFTLFVNPPAALFINSIITGTAWGAWVARQITPPAAEHQPGASPRAEEGLTYVSEQDVPNAQALT